MYSLWQTEFGGTNHRIASLLAEVSIWRVQRSLNCIEYNQRFPGWMIGRHPS